MSTVHKLTAVVIVIVAAVLAVFTSSPTLVPTTTRVPVTSTPLPAVDLSATPAGWVPVAFGDAQVSVPATWWVLYNKAYCPAGKMPGELFVNPFLTACTAVTVGNIPANRVALYPGLAFSPEHHKQVINGFAMYVSYQDYDVPSLGLTISAEGPLANRVLHTLSPSPRAVVLASGPGPAAQYGWHTLTFDGLSFTAPGWWPVTRTLLNYGIHSACGSSAGVSFFNRGVGGGEVVLSTDVGLAAFPCPIELGSPGPVYPGDGVEVDAGYKTLSELATEGLHPAFSKHCLDLHGLTACPATTPAYSILVLKVTVPGHKQPVFVSIGLAGNGMTSRTILDSLRPA